MWNLIPESKRAMVEKALQTAFGTTEMDELVALTDGLSGAAVYKLVVRGKPYVMRLAMSVDIVRDPERHFLCMQIASDGGVAPKVAYINVEDGLSIVAYLDAKPLAHSFPPPDVLAPALADMIRRTHALPLFPALTDMFEGVDAFIQIAREAGVVAPEATAELFAFYEDIKQRYPRHDPDRVSSHNDLNPNNVFFDGHRLWLVDWEASFQNDRYVDLALAANYYLPQEDQREALLTDYFGAAPDEVQRARFFLMRQVCLIFYGLIMLNMAATQRPDGTAPATTLETMTAAEFFGAMRAGTLALGSFEGLTTYGKIQLNRALADLKTPRYAEAMQALA